MKKSRIELEKRIVSTMIDIYYKNQKTREAQEEKEALKAYALKRLKYCKFGEEKGFCSHCSVHCYSEKYREQIKRVMAYSGPRLLFKHPIMLIRHILHI